VSGHVDHAADGFYFDLASPACYLVAEQILQALPGPLEWRPVLGSGLPESGAGELRGRIAELAEELGLQALRWPPRTPFDSETAMLAATYAKSIGRTVAFAQAAFRQAFAGGRDLGDVEHVLIAAAACEIHPRALLRALESRLVRSQLASATEAAARAGVRRVPTVVRAGHSYTGVDLLDVARQVLVTPTAQVCPS